MNKTQGKVHSIISNLVLVRTEGPVSQNEICFIQLGNERLMAEVIKVVGDIAYVQVFESTRGLKPGSSWSSKTTCWKLHWVPVCCQRILTVFKMTWIR